MKILVVYCHPSTQSFTFQVKEAFLRGLADAGHSWEPADLYAEGFNPVFSEEEYLREAFYDRAKAAPAEILAEQARIEKADGITFIYPVFWTEAPAVLTGWFQRVWTYGYAYGAPREMKRLKKALFLVTMGGSLRDEVRREQAEAMKTVMLGDRIYDRAEKSEMVIFDGMTRGNGNDGVREENTRRFLEEAYRRGLTFGET